jgi:hypothetical protein
MSCRQHRSRATVLFLGRPQVADRLARPVRRGRAAHRAYDVTGDDPSRLVVNADHRRQRGLDRRRLDAERQLLLGSPRGEGREPRPQQSRPSRTGTDWLTCVALPSLD